MTIEKAKAQSKIRSEYNDKGYYVARNLLNMEELKFALQDVHKIYALQLERFGIKPRGCATNEDMLADMKALFDKDMKAYLATSRMIMKLPSMQRLLNSREIMKIVHELGITFPTIPAEPYIVIMAEVLKIPGGYYGVGAHQDWTSMQGSLDAVIVWLPLFDVTRDIFPLEVIPGSHKRGMIPGKITAHAYELDQNQFKDEEFVAIEMKRGDVVFFTSFTVHRTGVTGNKTNIRIGCSTRYENAADPMFIERGYPTAYKRSVDREFITPNFPSKEQVRKVFE